MFIIRESLREDLDAIFKVAEHLDSYNLPADRKVIEEILEESRASFAGELPVQDRAFTFVAEDVGEVGIAGTSMVYAQHGTHKSPHLYLDVLQDEHYSETLDRYMVHQALRIGYNYNGPTEIGGLILLPEFRGHAESIGKLLSYARFLFIAMHREVFRDEVLSELLPPFEEDGTSRLWKHFGKRFTGLTYREADRLSKHNKEFIKSLFPQGLVYTSLFPQDVKDEIGEVGAQTKGVQRMLERIGFEYCEQIDPFDGGPHYTAKTDHITLVAQAIKTRVCAIAEVDAEAPRRLVARSEEAPHFACTWDRGALSDDGLTLSPEVAEALSLSEGDPVWTVLSE